MSSNMVQLETAQPQHNTAADLTEECEALLLSVAEKRKTLPAQCAAMLSKTLKKEIQHLMSAEVVLPQPDYVPRESAAAEGLRPHPDSAPVSLPAANKKMAAMIQQLHKANVIIEQVRREKSDTSHQFIHKSDS